MVLQQIEGRRNTRSISTILPATAKAIAELHQQFNNHYLASPVMGRPEAARTNNYSFLFLVRKA